jgi:hypothetical protein
VLINNDEMGPRPPRHLQTENVKRWVVGWPGVLTAVTLSTSSITAGDPTNPGAKGVDGREETEPKWRKQLHGYFSRGCA